MEAVSIDADVDGRLTVVLRGEIDYTNAGPVSERIRAAVAARRPAAVRVELGEVTFLDSSGIALLVNALKAAESAGAAYRVAHPNPNVADQLRMTGLLEPFGLAEPSPGGGAG